MSGRKFKDKGKNCLPLYVPHFDIDNMDIFLTFEGLYTVYYTVYLIYDNMVLIVSMIFTN